MGIYEKGKLPRLKPKEFLFPVLVAIIVIAILLGVWFLGTLFEPRVMNASFYKSPWALSDSNSNVLSVRVTNIDKADARDVIVSASSVDPQSIRVDPKSQGISVIGAGDSRIINFSLLPAQARINSGTYSFDLSVKMNGKTHSMRASVEVQS